MRYYLFITTLIRNIGGGHIYTRNKIKYLQKEGYDIGFFHADVRTGKIIIKDLLAFEHDCDIHLQYPPYFFTKKAQQKVVQNICDKIPKKYSEIIIESQTLTCSAWGELVAVQLNAKHLVFLLSEYQYLRNIDIYNFAKFKLERKELAGIQEKSLPLLFNGWQNISKEESYYLLAHCSNGVENIPYDNISKIHKSDFTIGSIGRIDKLFVLEFMKELVLFAKKHDKQTFTLILIGGASHGRHEDMLKKVFKGVPNVYIHITGLIFPIPRGLLLIPDVFISTGGSCLISENLNKLTISIDINDFKPIGIVGETTSNLLYRDNELKTSIDELLDSILIKKEYERGVIINTDEVLDYDYSSHLKFIENSLTSKEYFDISKAKLSGRDRIDMIGLYVLGIKIYSKVFSILSPVWMKLKN